MKRRQFITLLLSTAVSWPLAAGAQQRDLPLAGFLHSGAPRLSEAYVAAFRRGLADAGFVEDKSVTIEYRWAYSQAARLPALAVDLINLKPRVILAAGSMGPAIALKKATETIPIVFAFSGDPVKYGLVESLNRPGGNITGITAINSELAGKRLNLLRELLPQAKTVAFLTGTPNYLSYQEQTSLMLEAGRALGLQILIVECRDDRDFEQAFATMVEHRVDGLVLGPFVFRNANKIVDLAARHSIPAIYWARWSVTAGGLMSYGPEMTTAGEIAADYVARILKGAKPADLPVRRINRYEFVINLKTAKTLGLTIPRTLFAAATELID